MDTDIKKEFDDLKSFIRENVTPISEFEDLKNFLRQRMATKDDIASINERLDRHEARLDQLTIAVDNLTKLTKDYYEEMAVLRHRVERMEKWIIQVAETTGVKYEA